VIARSPLVLTVLTTFGAVYLLWAGITTVIRPPAPGAAADLADWSWVRRAAKGAGVSGLNPKALLLFLAFLPQFLTRGAAWPFAAQIALLGLVHTANCAVVYTSVGDHRRGAAGTACRRHGGDPVFGSRDDRHRRPPARRAPARSLSACSKLAPGASLTWHPEVPVRSRAPMGRAVCFPGC
jgi:hypothetical protein